MTVRLKKTDVAIVGLGAVGGVAALPLTCAGLEVTGVCLGHFGLFRGMRKKALKALIINGIALKLHLSNRAK